jgi:hypothetical protein
MNNLFSNVLIFFYYINLFFLIKIKIKNFNLFSVPHALGEFVILSGEQSLEQRNYLI